MKSPYSARLSVSSAAIILCGICNFFLGLLRRAIHVISTVKDAAEYNLDYKDVGTWTGLLRSFSDAIALFNLSVSIMTIVEIVSGAVGIIFLAALHSDRFAPNFEKFKILPFLCGIISCIFGVISFLFLIVSKSSSIFFCTIMFLTLLIVPIIFTVFSNKFWRGDKK